MKLAEFPAGALSVFSVGVDQAPISHSLYPETGMQGIEITTWFGLFAPASTPAELVNRLNRDAQAALKTMRDGLVAQGVEPAGSTPAQFAEFLSLEQRKWEKVVRDAKLKFD